MDTNVSGAPKIFGNVANWFTGLKLGQKLLWASVFSILPVVFLGYLLAGKMQAETAFTKSEIIGSDYLRELWPAFIHLAATEEDDEHHEETVNSAAAAAAKFDPILKSEADSKAFLAALRDDGKVVFQLQAARRKFQVIGEKSNLILDPEIVSFYLMDAVVLRIPELIAASRESQTTLAGFAEKKTHSFDETAGLLFAIGRIESAANNIETGMASAFEANTDGSVKAAVEPTLLRLRTTSAALQKSVVGVADAIDRGLPIYHALPLINQQYGEFLAAADNAWQVSNSELLRVLKIREARLVNEMMRSLGIALASVLAAAGILYLTGRSVRNPIRKLISLMEALRSGNNRFDTPHLALGNEVGDIARALEASRLTSDELGKATSQIELKLDEESSRSARTADMLYEINQVVTAAVKGNFNRRISETHDESFLRELAKGINRLVSTVDSGISETVKVMEALAGGHVAERINGAFDGNFLRLQTNVNQLAEQMQMIAGRIGASANAVHLATREISTGVSDLSSRTEQQASSLEETAASMEELSATVRQNATHAMQANDLAATARQLAVNGGEITASAVSAMDKIETSSRRVSEIVGLIQEIAFQTNILALNAAVEAARAGEAGRGFAVVANEVRALAQRSAAASKDIKQLISETDHNVAQGVALVDQAGDALTEIVTSVRKVADIVSEIAAASQEQSSGIDQVSRAVTNMDELTQRNAALVEETNSALAASQNQVDQLRQAVSFFKLGDAAIPPVVPDVKAKSLEKQVNTLHDRFAEMARKLVPALQKVERGPLAQPLHAQPGDWKEF